MDELIEVPKGKLKEILRIANIISKATVNKDGIYKLNFHVIKNRAEDIVSICNEIIEGGTQHERS